MSDTKPVEELVIEPDPDMLSCEEALALDRHENAKKRLQMVDAETKGMTDREKARFILWVEAAAEDLRRKIDDAAVKGVIGVEGRKVPVDFGVLMGGGK